MRRGVLWALVAASCATAILTGCPQPAVKPSPPEPRAPVQPAPAPPEVPFTRQPVGDVDRLLSYYGHLSTLADEQLSAEYERTMRFYRQQYSDFTLMQLVLLRIMPGTAFRDSTAARDMLSSFLKEPRTRSSELRPLALLLQSMLVEQQQKDAESQAHAQKLKEETRRYEEVKQKLDALIDAERKMLERNKPVRKP